MTSLIPQWIFSTLIYGAIALALIAGFGLLAMLAKDWKNGELW